MTNVKTLGTLPKRPRLYKESVLLIGELTISAFRTQFCEHYLTVLHFSVLNLVTIIAIPGLNLNSSV